MRFLKPRWRKVIRDLWGNKWRTLLVVMSIAVGIIAVGVISGSQESLLRDLNGTYLATNPPSGMVIVKDDFNDNLVETVSNIRGVEFAQGRREFTVRFKLNPADSWQDMQLSAYEDYNNVEINILRPQVGKSIPGDKELVVERASLDWMGAQVGDTVIIQPADSKAKERVMEIVGTVHAQSGPPAKLAGRGAGFIARDTLSWLDEPDEFNRLDFSVAENKMDQDYITGVGEEIRRKIENSDLEVIFVRVPEPGQHPVNDVLQPLLILLSGLGGLSLVLSGFLVINTISALMTQQTRQIGMMKAIGARQGQIVRLYIVTVLAYGSLALLVAIPIGALGAYVFTSMMADFFNFDLTRFTIPPSVLATQVAIGLLVPLIVSLYPIITGTRITVREAISDYGVGKGRFGTNIIDRLLQNVRGMSRPLIISLRNTFRRKTRLSLTLLTLTLAGATFITIFSIRDSLLLTLDDALQYWNYQIGITFEQNYRIQEIERIASQVPDVMEIESWGFNSVRRLRPDGEDGDSIFLIALPAETNMLKPILLEGRWLEPADTNAVVINTELVDDEPDVKIGDSVILKLGNRKVTWQVVGLVQGILAGPFAYANYPYYAKVANNVNKASVTQINTNSMDGDVHAKISEQLEKEFTDAGFKIVRVDTVANIRETIKSRFDFLVSFLLAMAVVMAVVGGLGLTGTMSINVLERVREIGVMRAIGASDMAVLRLIITEGIIIGMLSWAIGTVVAFPLSKLISYQVGMQLFKSPLSFAFSINGIIIWLIVAVVLASFASFLPARGASQLTVREVLAYE